MSELPTFCLFLQHWKILKLWILQKNKFQNIKIIKFTLIFKKVLIIQFTRIAWIHVRKFFNIYNLP